MKAASGKLPEAIAQTDTETPAKAPQENQS